MFTHSYYRLGRVYIIYLPTFQPPCRPERVNHRESLLQVINIGRVNNRPFKRTAMLIATTLNRPMYVKYSTIRVRYTKHNWCTRRRKYRINIKMFSRKINSIHPTIVKTVKIVIRLILMCHNLYNTNKAKVD